MIIKQVDHNSEQYLRLHEKAGSVFNSPRWLRLYGSSIQTWGIFNLNSELIGALQVYVASKLGIRYTMVAPYSPSNALMYLNPALSAEGQNSFSKSIHEAIAGAFDKDGAALCISAFPVSETDMQPYFWRKFKVIPNYTYLLDLSAGEETLFENLSAEKRKSVRRAAKDNIKVEACNDYRSAFELVMKTFDRRQKKVNEALIRKIFFEFADAGNSFAFVAKQDGRPSACMFAVHDSSTAYYLLGGYDEANKHHGAGPTCMWQGILEARRRGLKTFDFEGSMIPEVEKYFRGFGPRIHAYYTIQKAWLPLEYLLKLKMRNRF